MAWEWVAPVITGVVGVVGTTGAVMIARSGRQHAEDVARTSSKAGLLQAREARLAEYFLDAVQIIQGATWSAINPLIADPPVLDAVPSESDERRVEAIVTLYCSPKLRVIYLEWADALTALRYRVWSDDPNQAGIEQQAGVARILRAQRGFEELAREELEMYS